MNEAQRRREIKDYYLGISADEITSYLTPASFDLWESVARYRRELGIGDRWLEVDGGGGDLAAAALDRGYDVVMTDVQGELLETAAARHPLLRGRLERSWGLHVPETHSLYHRYPPTPAYDAEFDERMLRLFLHRAETGRPRA